VLVLLFVLQGAYAGLNWVSRNEQLQRTFSWSIAGTCTHMRSVAAELSIA
jgi:hypothetical protein